jgi:hypothetical protein
VAYVACMACVPHFGLHCVFCRCAHRVSQPGKGTTISDRGAGVLFGPDITENFCAVNGVSLVIRSHECMQEGFAVRISIRVKSKHATCVRC